MKEFEAHNACFFYCPRCESRTFIREAFVDGDGIPRVEPVEPYVCKR